MVQAGGHVGSEQGHARAPESDRTDLHLSWKVVVLFSH